MDLLKRMNDKLMSVIRWISILMFAVMLGASSLQIVMRFVFRAPLAWTDEVSRYCFVWGTMLGCAYLVRTRGHSRVEVLSNALKGMKGRVHGMLLDILCLVFYAIVIQGGVTLIKAGSTSYSVACSLPMGLVYSIVPVSGALMFLFQLEHILWGVTGAREREDNRGNSRTPDKKEEAI